MAISAGDARNAVCGPGWGPMILPCAYRGGGPCEAWWRGRLGANAPPPHVARSPSPANAGEDLRSAPIVGQPKDHHRPRRHSAPVRILMHRPIPEHAQMPPDIDQSALLVRELEPHPPD